MSQKSINDCFPLSNIEVQLSQNDVRQIAIMITDAYERLSRLERREYRTEFEHLLNAINVNPQLLDLI